MKTGARDNSAAFRSEAAGNFTGEPIGARRVDRGTIAAIGTVERGTGAVSENAGTRDARDARGDTRDRTRRRERGRAETIFDEGRGRSRARGRGTGPRARPVRHPRDPPAQKSTSPCQRVGRVRKNGVRSVRRDGETFTTRPSTGRFGWMFARHTSDASTDARFAIDARRSPSATRGLRRSRGETFATNLRCLFPDGGIRVETARGLAPASERRGRVRSRVHARDGRRLAYLRDTRARAFPRSPPGVGTRCVVPARRARTQVTGWFGSLLRGRSPRTH